MLSLYCAICATECQNEFSLLSHLNGKNHRLVVAKMLPSVTARAPIHVWGKYSLHYCLAKEVVKGDIVLIISELTILQGQITGLTMHGNEVSTHVLTLDGSSAVIQGGIGLARVCDQNELSPALDQSLAPAEATRKPAAEREEASKKKGTTLLEDRLNEQIMKNSERRLIPPTKKIMSKHPL